MIRTVLVLAVCLASAFATDFKACDGGRPSPTSIEVSGCETLPCDFVHGTDLDSKVSFISPVDAGNLRPKVMVTTLGLTIDFPLPDQDVCANLIWGGCPLATGDEAIYQLIMPILNEYPLVTLTIEFSVIDEADNTLVCFIVDGQVVDP